MKRLLDLFSIFLCLPLLIQAHGIGLYTQTLSWADNTRWFITKYYVIPSSEEQYVRGYDLKTRKTVKSRVISVGESETNCYYGIWFDNSKQPDIQCTPTQEFYLPEVDEWRPAHTLRVGDALLREDLGLQPITKINFVKEPFGFKIYSLHTETHNFFVGKYCVLTHNMVIALASLGFEIAFGSGAVGGTAAGAAGWGAAAASGAATGATTGSFLGPITIVGGFVIGGLIGLTIKAITSDKHRVEYNVNFDAGGFGKYFKSRSENRGPAGDGPKPGPEDSGGPGGPKKPGGGKDDKKNDDSNQGVPFDIPYEDGDNNKESQTLSFFTDEKVEKQMPKRGWDRESIFDAINNPEKTTKCRDTRWMRNSQEQLNDPATAYYHKNGGYVVRNDKTGDIVQVSNRKDVNWREPWN